MPASTSSLRWCETVGWLRPTGSVRSHTHASWFAWAATKEISRSRAGSDSALNPAASVAASSGLITCRTTGVQQSASRVHICRVGPNRRQSQRDHDPLADAPTIARHLRTLAQHFRGDLELLEQLLIRGRLFERVELHTVDVLEESISQHRVIVGVPDDRGDRVESRFLGGPPPALAHDDLEAVIVGSPHHDRLHQAELSDRVDEFGQCLFVEDLTRLLRVPVDSVDRDLEVHRPGGRGELTLIDLGGRSLVAFRARRRGFGRGWLSVADDEVRGGRAEPGR